MEETETLPGKWQKGDPYNLGNCPIISYIGDFLLSIGSLKQRKEVSTRLEN